MIAAALLALELLLGQADAGTPSDVRITVRAIGASNDPALPPGMDPRLDPIEQRIRRFGELLRFRSLRLLSQKTFDLGWHAPAEMEVPGGRTLRVIARQLDAEGKIRVHFEVLPSSGSRGLHTNYSIERGGTVLMGWLPVDPALPRAGKLLIAVTHEIEQ